MDLSVVIAIITTLIALPVPALLSLKGTGDVTKAACAVAGR